MKAVVTRVKSASVAIEGEIHGQIGQGFLIRLGIAPDDPPEKCRKLAETILGLRVFRDENDKMNRSILDAGGEILAISQFTLHGDVRHGRRPSFIRAARPEVAVPMYDAYCQGLREAGIHVETGIFQTDMKVSLVNDGPVTLLIDSRRTF